MRENFILLILITLLIFGFSIFIWQGIFIAKDKNSKIEKVFLVKKGEGSKEIALNLEKEGLIKQAVVFRIYVLTTGIAKKLQAGDYLVSPAMNIPEITEKFVRGDTIKEKISIIEGWNLRDIGFYFENRGMFQAEELWEIAGFPAIDYSTVKDLPLPKDFSPDYDFLQEKPKNIGLEGYLFPDTYEIDRGITLEEIIRKQLSNFDKKISKDLREEIKNRASEGSEGEDEGEVLIAHRGKTLFEIITMASIIEKEVRTLEDKKLVSGILWKRRDYGMPLQADATVAYITGATTTKVSIEETQIDSPYNTYKYKGLPIGPIGNPGLESILAAVYSKSSRYWYYLSAPDGETHFSETLEEHNIKKAKYLK